MHTEAVFENITNRINYNQLNTSNFKIYKCGNGDKNLAEINHENIVINYGELALAK